MPKVTALRRPTGKPRSFDERPANETVDLSLRLLEATRDLERTSRRLRELAREFAASKATVYRHLQTLMLHGFVRQEATTMRYAAGIKLFILGERLRERFDVLPIARDDLARLRDETGQPADLVRAGRRSGRGSGSSAGSRDRQFRNATRNRARSSCERPRKRRVGVRSRGPDGVLPGETASKRGHRTRSARRVLFSVPWRRLRARGWATAPNRVLEGVNGLAAPLFNHGGDYAGAVAIAGSIQYIPASPPPVQIRAVTQTAERISRKLGWNGRWPRTGNGS